METIKRSSRIVLNFTLEWKSEHARHVEWYRADPVSLWRDVLNPALVDSLLGKSVGSRCQVQLTDHDLPWEYQAARRLRIRPGQFHGTDGTNGTLMKGRYYPQGFIHGVGGIYQASRAPCLFLGIEDKHLLFDCNHPLAGRDVKLEAEIAGIYPGKAERGGRCEDWLECLSADGPGMEAGAGSCDQDLFQASFFKRSDEQDDRIFYQKPRMVHHLDSHAREAIGQQYAALIPGGGKVLDLMASWDSHLPPSLALSELTVLGLNAQELETNARATTAIVQDLNTQPELPFPDASLDTVLCTAAIEYLRTPLQVLTEAYRVLKPGGALAVSFSNRWFPPKAIAIWSQLHEFERLGFVTELVRRVGGFTGLTTLSRRGLPRPEDDPHSELWVSDPVYMVWAKKEEQK